MWKSVFILLCTILFFGCDQQHADRSFDAKVFRPAFTADHPRVLFDQGHNNMHRMDGTYRPFVDLISNDGCSVASIDKPFTQELLQPYDILVIANPKGKEKKYESAFTEEECSAVEQWVRGGGNLLLIADHHPIGSATEILSKHFGVAMSRGFTNDSVYFDSTSFTESQIDGKSQLIFSRANGLIADHPITAGRDSTERINKIISFTGQSLSGAGIPFLILSSHAADVIPDSIWETKGFLDTDTHTRFAEPVSAAGKAQGIALEFGKGRVVVMGEAAMLTAQQFKEEKFGMQQPGLDNKQLVLNIVRWLGRAL